ncbi:MAG: hypothetical protein MUO76_19305 [Anaerolineaceae bacterium]|nr:hypothetical protein [Anaerolineaceae bacterium]
MILYCEYCGKELARGKYARGKKPQLHENAIRVFDEGALCIECKQDPKARRIAAMVCSVRAVGRRVNGEPERFFVAQEVIS